jgi:hypothetical protein
VPRLADDVAALASLLEAALKVFAVRVFPARITPSRDNENFCPGIAKNAATAMSIAIVADELSYRDSGQRQFFQLSPEGHVSFQRRLADGTRTGPDALPGSISFSDKRSVVPTPAPAFDMIAAGGGRVFAKQKNQPIFYINVLDPMFLTEGGNIIPSLYFKLDPEQGQVGRNDRDRLAQVPDTDFKHPAAVRFPLFRIMLSLPFIDSMAVDVDLHRGVWHEVDLRPPSGGAQQPSMSHVAPPSNLVEYTRADGTEQKKGGFAIYSVLDIGVGHEHWYEAGDARYGGEMDSLNGPGLPPVLIGRDVYSFFNGPVSDKGGFIDGTANYYVLAQLVPDTELDGGVTSRSYGILWADEQAVFSERWRLLHPDDCNFGGFNDLVPSSLVQYLARTPWWVDLAFDRTKFFCPFRAMHIGKFSRMAVARQVIVVNGFDPVLKEHVLHSINFSFGTGDRTWRWRPLPPMNTGPVGPPVPRLPTGTPFEPPPFTTLGMCEDTTIYVVENGGAQIWYQYYLPAGEKHTPDDSHLRLPNLQLLGPPSDAPALARLIAAMIAREPLPEIPNGPKPEAPFPQHWQSLPAATWNEIHARYPFFGVLDDQVDSRSQYYLLKMGAPPPEFLEQPIEEATGALFIDKPSLDWDAVNAIVNQPQLPQSLVEAGQEPQQLQQLVNDLLQTLKQLGPEVAALETEVENAWNHALGLLSGFLNSLPQSARSAVRTAVRDAASAIMFPSLQGMWPYTVLSAHDRHSVDQAFSSALDSVLDPHLFDALWNAIGQVPGDVNSIFAELQQLSSTADIPAEVANEIVAKARAAVSAAFGSVLPQVPLSFTLKVDILGFRQDFTFELPSISITLAPLRNAIEAGLRGLAWFTNHVTTAANAVKAALQKAAQWAESKVQRASAEAQLAFRQDASRLYRDLTAALQQVVGSNALVKRRHTRSLYHDRFLFRLLFRPPLGYVLVFYDKRDDDLLPFNNYQSRSETVLDIRLQISGAGGPAVPATITRHRSVRSRPAVSQATITVVRDAKQNPTALRVRFSSPTEKAEIAENIWRVRIGAMSVHNGKFGPADVFFDELRHEFFQQVSATDHEGTLQLQDAQTARLVSECCSASGRAARGTSIWFEDVVGHVSAPDEIVFA